MSLLTFTSSLPVGVLGSGYWASPLWGQKMTPTDKPKGMNSGLGTRGIKNPILNRHTGKRDLEADGPRETSTTDRAQGEEAGRHVVGRGRRGPPASTVVVGGPGKDVGDALHCPSWK